MKLMFNSVYGRTAFIKAAESLAKFLEAGKPKPTYDQLLEENEKLRKENRELKCKSCGKNAKLYVIDDIIGATGPVEFPTYDELRKECEELRAENEVYKGRNIKLRDEIDKLRVEKDTLFNASNQLIKDRDSLQAEIDELDKECDTLVEEKEKLQAEVDSLKDTVKGYEKRNEELIISENYVKLIELPAKEKTITKLINELSECKAELHHQSDMTDYYRKLYLEATSE